MAASLTKVSPEASFDLLYVVDNVGSPAASPSLDSVQVFVYLAALLALYDGRPVAEWGYEFISTPTSAPFSSALFDASEALQAGQRLRKASDGFVVTDLGRMELSRWAALDRFAGHIPYLDGATGASTVMPISSVRAGVEMEPQLARARSLNLSRELLDDVGLTQIYSQFAALQNALGNDVPDYMVPAVVWLTFLLEKNGTAGEG